jgi:hypothetical protein
VIDLSAFEAAGALLNGMLPADLGTVKQYAHRYGIKVWFDTDKATKEHYEAQVVSARDLPANDKTKTFAIEVGFHSEHPKEAENEAVIAKLLLVEKRWRKEIGKEAEAAPFFGRAQHWRRVSETWPDPDLEDPELAFEIAARLTDYITAIEPLRRSAS